MANRHHWTLDGWGDEYPPENAEEIIRNANAEIDAYTALHPDADDDEIAAFSDSIWDAYCGQI